MPSIDNLVHQTSTTAGTGSLTVSTVDGRQSFSDAFGTGATQNAFYYFISHHTEAEWEVGTGHVSDATTLVRDTVLASSNANNKVDFSAGTKDVTNDIPAAKQVSTDATQALSNKTLTAPDINGGTADALTSLGVRSTSAAFDLKVASDEVLTADRTLKIDVGDTDRKITLLSDLAGFGVESVLLDNGTDLDTVTDQGFYDVNTPVHGPLSGGIVWLVHVLSNGSSTTVQVAYERLSSDARVFVRQTASTGGGTWSAWKEYLTADPATGDVPISGDLSVAGDVTFSGINGVGTGRRLAVIDAATGSVLSGNEIISSSALNSSISDPTGTGAAVFGTGPTISGGTIDNAVIGGTTPAEGTFTDLTATDNFTMSGTAPVPTDNDIANLNYTGWFNLDDSTAAGLPSVLSEQWVGLSMRYAPTVTSSVIAMARRDGSHVFARGTTGDTWHRFILGDVDGNVTLPGTLSVTGDVSINGGTADALTSLGIRSTGASFDLKVASDEVLTADRTITVTVNGANRSLNLEGDLHITGNFSTVGSDEVILRTPAGPSDVNLPATGTLATLAGTETLEGKTLADPNVTGAAQFESVTGDKIRLYGNTFGIGIESGTLTSWSSGNFLWRIGGAGVGAGTETARLSADGLDVAVPVLAPSLQLEDSDASHHLIIETASNLTADRTLTINPGNANRTVTISGNLNFTDSFTLAGSDATTLTTAGVTNVILPTTGTLATLAGAETLINKDLTSTTNKILETFGIALSDETTALGTGLNKATFSLPYAFTVTGVYATLNTASSSGAVTVDINVAGTTILSTKLTVDAGEKTSATAATPAVISDASIAANAGIGFDIDGAGSGAKGLKVFLTGHRT